MKDARPLSFVLDRLEALIYVEAGSAKELKLELLPSMTNNNSKLSRYFYERRQVTTGKKEGKGGKRGACVDGRRAAGHSD